MRKITAHRKSQDPVFLLGMRGTVLVAIVVFLTQISPAQTIQIVLDFEDLPASFPGRLPLGYAGLEWDSYYDGDSIYWDWGSESIRPDYSEPHSGDNYLLNAFGDNHLGFSMPDPGEDRLLGAWFTQTTTQWTAEQIRFNGYDSSGVLIQQSSWLTLSHTPSYLEANFEPVAWIRVERTGYKRGTYFTMDDLTYIPEPMTIALFGIGGLTLLKRRRKSTSGLEN